ncbi:hypothetical protein GCM10009623_36040 [Nocardioides aestuarii]|uniref:ANTAR domain-containing protein n=1 Tax=Nocardioides aestuarii TaxID=252231 RepID=A0ABW4TUW8_9ACTN
MIGPADLTRWRHDEEFREDPVPLLVLDRDLVIRAVNRAHEQVMGFPEAALVSRDAFDAYPANPGAEEGDDGRRSMEASFERVLRHRHPHHLVLQRYDIPDVASPDRFLPRTWLPVNAPVWAAGEVAGIVVRAEEVRVPDETHQVLRAFREVLREQGAGEEDLLTPVVQAVVWALRSWGETLREAEQLREALTSRATIDQAKGILMGRHGVTAEAAFAELVRLSNDSNVRLAEVASALIYQVQHP